MRDKYISIMYEDNGRNVLREINFYETYEKARKEIKEILEKENSNVIIHLYETENKRTYIKE